MQILGGEKDIMKNNTKRFVAIIRIGLALVMPINKAFAGADSEFLSKLTAQWWQWALSIPTSVNPQTDTKPKGLAV